MRSFSAVVKTSDVVIKPNPKIASLAATTLQDRNLSCLSLKQEHSIPIMAKSRLLLLYLLFATMHGKAQGGGKFQIRTIAFYNVENLFDTVNDSLVYDDDRTPSGIYHWTTKRYQKKIENLAKVLSQIGLEKRHAPPDIIGLCEVENAQVLQDLTDHTFLRGTAYGIIHYDGPDERGIDVALLYNTHTFTPISIKKHGLILLNYERQRDRTRDQLVVHGILDSESIYIIVNHWPSRSGGEGRSRPYRIAAAELNRHIIDSIFKTDSSPRILSIGDFNDNPTDYSLKKVLRLKKEKALLKDDELFNPMEKIFRNGEGTMAYRDRWGLFDQLYVTGNLVNGSSHLQLWKVGIFRPSYLVTKYGSFVGYPLRTYSGGRYTGGYSDHFPIYGYLIRKVDRLLGQN
jgi:hypothetical protein